MKRFFWEYMIILAGLLAARYLIYYTKLPFKLASVVGFMLGYMTAALVIHIRSSKPA